MNNKLILFVGIALIVVLGAGVVLMSSSSNNSDTFTEVSKNNSEDMDQSSVTDADNQTDEGNTKKFSVTGKNFTFSPTSLTVNKGDTVQIVFDSSSGTHDFVIDELNVRTKMVASGGSDTVEFKADKVGVFEFYCSFGNHRQMGMKGTLTVK